MEYSYAIHYDKKGLVKTITQESVGPFGEDIEQLRHAWVMMAEAFGQPILDYSSIPEPGCDRKEEPMASVVEERMEELRTSAEKREEISWEEVKRELEEKGSPSDRDEYRGQVEEERVEKKRVHNELFIGTPTLKELIEKILQNTENGYWRVFSKGRW